MKRATLKQEVADVIARPVAEYQSEAVNEYCTEAANEVVPPVDSLVPYEGKRPCFTVFDDWVLTPGKKYRPGVWHFGKKASRKEDAQSVLTEQWVCTPLYVEAVTTDQGHSNFGRLLRFKPTIGAWKEWAMPMELLRADGSDLRGMLLTEGVEIDPGGHAMLTRYLQDRTPSKRIRCVQQTGWADTERKAFVLPDTVIGPNAAQVTYQTAGEYGQDEYTTGGTLAEWQSGIAALAPGNPVLTLALCAAFAGPVLARCNAESGGIHFVGDSSTGKTSAIEAACSVWGGRGFKRSWRATANGMEGVASLFNDGLLALDEISECDPREVGAIVYSLGNGRGKQRASCSGAARGVTQWRCSVLSSGERTIKTTMAEGGHRIKAGQTVRLLDIPVQRTSGAWDDLHGHASGVQFSDALKNASATQYGHAGRAFLEKLTRDGRDLAELLHALKGAPRLQAGNGNDGQALRAAGRFALMALAGELATDYGVTGWASGEALTAAATGFEAWLTLRGNVTGNSEQHQIAGMVRGFIERHGDSRFSDVQADEARTAMVRDRAGWWQDASDGRVYLFTSDGMNEATKGVDLKRALDALQAAGALDAPGADGKRAKFRRINGRGVKVYIIKADKLGGDDV